MISMKIILLLLLAIFPSVINAQVYKCKNAAGKITYSESACPENMRGGEIVIEDNAIDSSFLREKVQSHKNLNTNSSVTNTTVTTRTNTNIPTNYMSSYDRDIRLNQLKVQMSDQSFNEKRTDAKNEFSKVNKARPKSLSHDLEQRRKNLKVDLTHPDPIKRRTALTELSKLYSNY